MIPQVQLTRKCNLACSYCFEDHSDPTVMSYETLENFLVKYVAYQQEHQPQKEELEIYWHGGEPLLAGQEFYQKIIEIQGRFQGVRFDNRIQTNGVALKEKLARFLLKNNFHLGFSMDGPEATQNEHRRRRSSDRGSFAAVMRGIQNYKRLSPDGYVPVIAVVSRFTVERGAQEFYQFFKDMRASLQFQPYDVTCYDLLKPDLPFKDHAVMAAPQDYAQFVIDLFELWFKDDPKDIVIKDLKDEIKKVLIGQGFFKSVADKKRCLNERTIIDPQGRVFSCDMYVNNEQTALGDINKDSIEEIMARKFALWEQIKTAFRKEDSAFKCLWCAYGDTCSGGCMTCMKYNYLVLKGFSLENPDEVRQINAFFARHFPDCGDAYYCRAFRKYRQHIAQRVKAAMDEEHLSLQQVIKVDRV